MSASRGRSSFRSCRFYQALVAIDVSMLLKVLTTVTVTTCMVRSGSQLGSLALYRVSAKSRKFRSRTPLYRTSICIRVRRTILDLKVS